MFTLIAAAAVLPLSPITADDARLEKRRTFVSEAAKIELAEDTDERVLCLDRYRASSICLTETEWKKTIELAKNAPKKGPNPFIPPSFNNTFGSGDRTFGLASSPSTFRSH